MQPSSSSQSPSLRQDIAQDNAGHSVSPMDSQAVSSEIVPGPQPKLVNRKTYKVQDRKRLRLIRTERRAAKARDLARAHESITHPSSHTGRYDLKSVVQGTSRSTVWQSAWQQLELEVEVQCHTAICS